MLTFLWILLSLLWWTASLTVLLPLTAILTLSQTARSAFFSWFYSVIIDRFFMHLTNEVRWEMFQILRNSVGSRKKSVPLEVLEIGIGGGQNLPFYPENCNLTVLDKNKFFESYFSSNAQKFPHIYYRRTIIQPAERMSQVEDNSFDVVVTSYLHCSCSDSEAVLREIKRVLKPGGKYVFNEHVRFPSNELGLLLQKFINPIWYLFFGGCNLHRDTAPKIKQAGFSKVICDKYRLPYFWTYLPSYQILGVATK